MPLQEVMTTDQVAELLGVTRRMVRYWANRGTLPAQKIGRDWVFLTQDVHAFAATWQRRRGRPPRGSR